MSANFPPGLSDNGADATGRASAANRTGREEARGAVRQAGNMSLRSDLANLKNDLDALLAQASTLSDMELRDAYGKMMTKFSSLRYAARGIAVEAGRQLNQGVDVTSDYVKGRPLQAVFMAAGVGMVLGLLIGRR